MNTARTARPHTSAGPAESAQARADSFATRAGVLAATLGAAVGLGNIWRFPFLTGANGGGAFLVVYLLCTLLIGLPIMIAELAIGRRARRNTVAAFQALAPAGQPWWLVGAAGVVAAFLVLGFYTAVVGWVLAYVVKFASGTPLTADPEANAMVFAGLIGDPAQALLWQWAALGLAGAISMLGVARGIERATRLLMPLLFLLLLVVAVRGLTLPGAAAGLAFLFWPDFSKLSAAMVLTAMGLAFFKLSIGMGALITYGSYFRADQNMPATAARVMLADLAVSLLAGIAIFPAVFSFGYEPDAGPGLLFITIPAVFAAIPFGGVFVVVFFLLAAVAATGAMLSLLEVPVAFFHAHFGRSRRRTTMAVLAALALIGAPAALSFNLLAEATLFGKTPFDLYDYLTSNLLLPLGGLFTSLFVGWVWGYDQVRRALTNEGALGNGRVVAAFYAIVRLVAPVLVAIVLLKGLGLF